MQNNSVFTTKMMAYRASPINLLKQISIPACIIFFIFLADLIFFRAVDVYHQHFFSKGVIVVLYHLARLIFIPCLIWILYFSGNKLLQYICHKNDASSEPEGYLAAIFTGTGIWQLGLFVIGLLGFYHYFFICGLTLLLFLFSLPHLSIVLKKFNLTMLIKYLPAMVFLAVPVFLFLISKGLYPAGGHDYYNHYFQFYRKVIDSGNILPNEIWYHFYYSKGAGLFFMSMLLTDPLAPQLVTTAILFASTALIFSVLRAGSSWRILPWLGVFLFILFYIYTPGPHDSLRNTGWGDLEKLHELSAMFIIAILWSTIKIMQEQDLRVWGMTLLFTTISIVLMNPPVAIFSSSYCVLIFLCLLYQKKYRASAWCLASIMVAGTGLLSLLIINYLYTGIPNDQGLFRFWSIINFDKVRAWGMMFELIVLHYLRTVQIANQVSFSLKMIFDIASYLRIDVWGFLLFIGVLLVLCCLFFRKWRKTTLQAYRNPAFFAVALFISAVFFISLIIGRDQAISFYRFTSFTYGPMLCLCLFLLAGVLPTFSGWLIMPLLVGLVFYGFSFGYTLTSYFSLGTPYLYNFHHKVLESQQSFTYNVHEIFKNAAKFAIGRYSLKDAYQNQQGWPGRMPWGGIYPPMETIWRMLPLKTRIWSMHIHSYCMLPDCHVEGYMSFKLSSHPDILYYGNPQDAKYVLQKEGLNFFFISPLLKMEDFLPLSPLFSPNNISNYLGFYWTDGDNALLTWKENAKKTISAAWLLKYATQVENNEMIKSFPFNDLKPLLITAQKPKSKILEKNIPWYHAGWK